MHPAQPRAAARGHGGRLRFPRRAQSRGFDLRRRAARAQRLRAVPPRGPHRARALIPPLAQGAARAPAALGAARQQRTAPGAGGGGGEARGASDRLDAARGAARAGQARGLPRARAHAAAWPLGREPAAAHEADRHEPRHGARANPHRGAPRQARGAHAALPGGGERRAVGLRRREQRGVLLAALEGDARLRRRRHARGARLAQPRASG